MISITMLSRTSLAIVNGEVLSSSDPVAESIVALQMQDLNADGSRHFYHGSAVVIGRKFLITAAHNVFYLKDRTSTQAILKVAPLWEDQDPTSARIRIKAVRILPGFRMDKDGTINDLAVVSLERDLPSFYRPMRIATLRELRRLTDDHFIIAGYGLSREGRLNLSDLRLRKGVTQIEKPVNRTGKLWFSGSPSSIGGGDSGGAAFRFNGTSAVLFGIAIHHRYGADGKPMRECAFTNLGAHLKWITEAIRALQ